MKFNIKMGGEMFWRFMKARHEGRFGPCKINILIAGNNWGIALVREDQTNGKAG